MKSLIATVLIALGVILLWILIWGYRLERKLEVITQAPGVRVVPTKFIPAEVRAARRVDLGYAQVSLPAFVREDPVFVEDGDVVCVGSSIKSSVCFFPPNTSGDPRSVEFFSTVSAAMGVRLRNMFEVKLLELRLQPFTVWDIPSIGRSRAEVQASLLMLKGLWLQQAYSVQTYEDHGIAAIIWNGPPFTSVEIEDVRSGVWQVVSVPKSKDAQAIVSEILGGYRIASMDCRKTTVEALARKAGLRILPSIPVDGH